MARFLLATILLAAAPVAAQGLPADIAAAHPEGKWRIRKAGLYRYLVRYKSGHPSARIVFPDFLKQRLIQSEARKRKITVTDRDAKRWLDDLDAQIRKNSGGTMDLKQLMVQQEMSNEEMDQRARLAIQRERVARSIMNESDPTRKKDQALQESAVIVVIDRLFKEAPKEVDRSKLPKGIFARIGTVEITDYEYGRELAVALPATEVYRALQELILVEEVRLLLGNDDPPAPEELEQQKSWFLAYERNRLGRLAGGRQTISNDMIRQVLAKRGLTLEQVFANPAFLAQARARGHFRRKLTEDDLRKWHEEHKERYGDQLKVARILVVARAQRVKLAGKKVRTLQQGKALADAIWVRATQGQEFADLARENSDDPDVIKRAGGVVPLWLTADTPGYEDTWQQANALKAGGVSRPFFSQGRGYVIVKLLDRKKALDFEGLRKKIRDDAAEQAYGAWRFKALRAAIKSETLLDDAPAGPR